MQNTLATDESTQHAQTTANQTHFVVKASAVKHTKSSARVIERSKQRKGEMHSGKDVKHAQNDGKTIPKPALENRIRNLC